MNPFGAPKDRGSVAAVAISSAATAFPAYLSQVKKRIICRTPIHYSTLNPLWEFQAVIPEVQSSDGLYIEAWDYDQNSADDFLGACFVSLGNSSLGSHVRLVLSPRPKKKDTGITGFLTASFSFSAPLSVSSLVRKKLTKRQMMMEGVTGKAPAEFVAFKPKDGDPGSALLSSSTSSSAPSVPLSLTSSTASSSSAFTPSPSPPNLKPPSGKRDLTASQLSSLCVDEEEPEPIPARTLHTPKPTYSFSFHLTVHSGQKLKCSNDSEHTDPYIIISLIRGSDPDSKILLSRSHIVYRVPTASWEHSCHIPSIQSNDKIDVEVRDWNQAQRDEFLGHIALRFPEDRADLKDLDHCNVPLVPRSGRRDRNIQGSLTISYAIGEAEETGREEISPEDLAFSLLNKVDYEAIENLDIHSRNYGVAVANFRDVGGWPVEFRDPTTGIRVKGRMRTGFVFRTSGINRATERDAKIIMETLGIKSLVDLRTPDYAGNRGPFLSPYFSVLEPSKAERKMQWVESSQKIVVNASLHSATIEKSKSQSDQAYELEGPRFDFTAEDATRQASEVEWGSLYLMCIVGAKFRSAIISKTKKTRLVAAGLASTPQQQRRIICGPIFDPPDGITILYYMLVENCKREFCMLFELLLKLAQAGSPFCFFCNHGKDRTGLTAAFLQRICGVSTKTVIDNYQLSDYFLRPIKQEVDDEMADGGLTPAVMSRSPARAIKSLLLYLDQKYGGVSQYLVHVGFGLEQQHQLRMALVEIDDIYSARNLRMMSFRFLRVYSPGTVTIHRGVDLLASDLSGSSDPYVTVSVSSTLVSDLHFNQPKILGKTPVVPQCLYPEWNTTIAIPPINPGTRIRFEVLDADESCEDDHLGYAEYVLDPPEPFQSQTELHLELKPVSFGSISQGEIVISISFTPTATPSS